MSRHYLLAASGVPRASTLRDLNEFRAQAENPVIGLISAPFDTDIDAYVSQLQAKSNADLFREHMEQTKRDFDAFVEERFHMNLDEQRQRVYEHFGLAKPNERSAETLHDTSSSAKGFFGRSLRKAKGPADSFPRASFGASSMSRSLLGGTIGKGSPRSTLFSDVAERTSFSMTVSAEEDPFLRAKQDKYAKCVRDLNAARLQGRLYHVIDEFAKVENETGNDVRALYWNPSHISLVANDVAYSTTPDR